MSIPNTYKKLFTAFGAIAFTAVFLDTISDSWGLPMYFYLFFVFAFQIALILFSPRKHYIVLATVHFLCSFLLAFVSGFIIDFGMGPWFGSEDSAETGYLLIKYLGPGVTVFLGVVHYFVAMRLPEKTN